MSHILETLNTAENIVEIKNTVEKRFSLLIPEVVPIFIDLHAVAAGSEIRTSTATVVVGTLITPVITKFSLTTLPNNRHLAISCNSFVYPQYRKRGIATGMHDIKEFICRKVGISKMMCTVNKHNVAELSVLDKRGWTSIPHLNSKTFLTLYKNITNKGKEI